ncbi:MAG: AAA family ATPase, partial [Halothece sp.]
CHILIGCPSSGKSSLARQIQQENPHYQIISTDQIRAELFGDETIQGDWSQIDTQVYIAIDQALQAGIPIIYDATNAKRSWRMGLLEQLRQYPNVDWMGWYLKTPLETCLQWNQQRDRNVPESAIKRMSHWLKQFPPDDGEGFTLLHTLKPDTLDSWRQQVTQKISQLDKTKINRENRNHSLTFHTYSRLLDFERLMYLIRLLIQYPGLGNLQTTAPENVQEVLGDKPHFQDEVEEICAFLAKTADPIYANREAVAQDLQWLESNGLYRT